MIKGNVRTVTGEGFVKKVGIFTGEVVAINPDTEWLADNGMEPKEGSKATEYLGETEEGAARLTLSFWLKETNSQQLFNVRYYLEDKERINKDNTKTQYVNVHAASTWSDTPDHLPLWFTKVDYRVAKRGEADLYNFLKYWLGGIELKEAEAVMHLDWSKLMQGNVKELRDQINGMYCKAVMMPAVIETKDTDEGVKEYQKVFNRAVGPEYLMKYFRGKDYTDEDIENIKKSDKKNLKPHEKFIREIVDEEYGCKDFYSLKPLHKYDPAENIVGKREIQPENQDY